MTRRLLPCISSATKPELGQNHLENRFGACHNHFDDDLNSCQPQHIANVSYMQNNQLWDDGTSFLCNKLLLHTSCTSWAELLGATFLLNMLWRSCILCYGTTQIWHLEIHFVSNAVKLLPAVPCLKSKLVSSLFQMFLCNWSLLTTSQHNILFLAINMHGRVVCAIFPPVLVHLYHRAGHDPWCLPL